MRELENIIERAYVHSEGDVINKKNIILDIELVDCEKNRNITPEQLKQTVENCYWNKTKAAIKMGRSRRQIYRLLEKYKITDYIRRNFLL